MDRNSVHSCVSCNTVCDRLGSSCCDCAEPSCGTPACEATGTPVAAAPSETSESIYKGATPSSRPRRTSGPNGVSDFSDTVEAVFCWEPSRCLASWPCCFGLTITVCEAPLPAAVVRTLNSPLLRNLNSCHGTVTGNVERRVTAVTAFRYGFTDLRIHPLPSPSSRAPRSLIKLPRAPLSPAYRLRNIEEGFGYAPTHARSASHAADLGPIFSSFVGTAARSRMYCCAKKEELFPRRNGSLVMRERNGALAGRASWHVGSQTVRGTRVCLLA